ncbi:MAG: MqnA/MqnD/SBP family protein [Victivallaceae bacterium]
MSNRFIKSPTAWGCVSYLNALPFRLNSSSDLQTTVITDVPKNLMYRFLNDEFDIVLTSSACQFVSGASYLPNLGIAAYKQILSVNLYAKKGFFSSDRILTVGVTNETASSVILLKILAHFHLKISIVTDEFQSQDYHSKFYDAVLLIGDTALLKQTIPGYDTYDLAHEWYKFTQLPFVFALFLVKDRMFLKELQQIPETALRFAENNETLLLKKARQLYPQFSLSMLKAYYKLCIYRLGKAELKGLDRYRQLYEDLPKH